jgi:hypothetical protein
MEGREMIGCVVCLKSVERLFRHHDHFSDFCLALIPFDKPGIRYTDDGTYTSLWNTFPPSEICGSCNAICPEVKRNTPLLRKFVSFSPQEMSRLLSGGLNEQRDRPNGRSFPFVPWSAAPQLRRLVDDIWASKKEIYRPYLQKLIAAGVSKDDITVAWNDRSVTRDTAQDARKKSRQEMLAAIAKLPKIFHELCQLPGNDERLAALLYQHQLSSHGTSFVWWYHVKHGDSYLKKNHLGVGPMAFCGWFVDRCFGKVAEAARAIAERLRRERYWANRR